MLGMEDMELPRVRMRVKPPTVGGGWAMWERRRVVGQAWSRTGWSWAWRASRPGR